MSNQLSGEISQYLLQHSENPVQWHPWDSSALELARSSQKPIFLSIGYSSCHWCHVMAHESFENELIARILNEHFVSIKVDREERPDLDQIYMEAVQLMTGHGGWPLSVFLTPEEKPFYGGTYWPAQRRYGMPGFDQVLEAVAEAWERRRGELLDQAAKVVTILQGEYYVEQPGGPEELDERLLESAEAALVQSFDQQYGGFGPAPEISPAPCLAVSFKPLASRGRRRVAARRHYHVGSHGHGGNLRSSRRRISPLQRRCPLVWRRISKRCYTTMPC